MASPTSRGGSRLLADRVGSITTVPAQVKVEMVAMVGIVVGAEHGAKQCTAAVMHLAQEVALGEGAPPAALDGHGASVCQHKPRYVDGVGMAVLGQERAVDVVHWPAGIGACDFQGHQRAAKMPTRRRHH